MTEPPTPEEPGIADLDQCLDRYHQLATSTQNPLYAWAALQWIFFDRRQRWATEEPLILPAWIGQYLCESADEIMHLAVGLDPRTEPVISDSPHAQSEAAASQNAQADVERRRVDPTSAMNLVPHALGLRGNRNWNAFARFISATDAMQIARAHADMRAEGIASKTALYAIAKGIGVTDPSYVHARIREGKALLDPESEVGEKEG